MTIPIAARGGVEESLSGADLMVLAKPRITMMVVLTAALGALLAANQPVPAGLLAATLAGTALLAAAGSTLNQLIERDTDRLMVRTARRPLAAGRMRPAAGLAIGLALAAAGVAILLLAVNVLTAVLGAIAFGGYVFVYTPLKRRTSLATIVGAVPGAIPPMMGWTAVAGRLEAGAWTLFAILFLWQLPHFLAIAWMCRDDYRRAGLPMFTVGDTEGRRTALQMVLWAVALLPVSLVPSLLGLAGRAYFIGALALGLGLLAACVAFLLRHEDRAARRLLLASVLYLPAVLAVMALDRVL